MIAQELEVSLHMDFVEARQKRHEFITVEHLLLAMLDNPSAAEVLKACGVDLDELRGLGADRNLVLLDNGDLIQGDPASYHSNFADPGKPNRIQSGAIPECRLPHYGPDVTLGCPKDPKDPIPICRCPYMAPFHTPPP